MFLFLYWINLYSIGFGYGSGYIVNYSDIVPAYAGLIFGIVTAISSLGAVIANIVAGILIKRPILQDWRKLFILFFISYVIAGIAFIILGSAVPEPWAMLKTQEQKQNGVHSDDEQIPMKEKTDEHEQAIINEKTETDHTNNVHA